MTCHMPGDGAMQRTELYCSCTVKSTTVQMQEKRHPAPSPYQRWVIGRGQWIPEPMEPSTEVICVVYYSDSNLNCRSGQSYYLLATALST